MPSLAADSTFNWVSPVTDGLVAASPLMPPAYVESGAPLSFTMTLMAWLR